MKQRYAELPRHKLECVVGDYNEFVREWNRREVDRSERIPACGDDWCKIEVITDGRVHVVMFRYTDAASRNYYELIMARSFRRWHKGWSFCRNEIDIGQVKAAREVVPS